jgi:hypothetical protein
MNQRGRPRPDIHCLRSPWPSPSPTLAADMVKFLQGADPEQFEMWVEEPE